jgi:hypothetical protein
MIGIVFHERQCRPRHRDQAICATAQSSAVRVRRPCVALIGHLIADKTLLVFDRVWAAAGPHDAVFAAEPRAMVKAAQAHCGEARSLKSGTPKLLGGRRSLLAHGVGAW